MCAQNIRPPSPIPSAGSEVHSTPEVAREHSDLMNEIERLTGTVKELIDQLRPVIKAVPSAESGACTKREDCYSELGNCLRVASDQLRQEIAKLRDVMQTLAIDGRSHDATRRGHSA